jgi:hypothetical protein
MAKDGSSKGKSADDHAAARAAAKARKRRTTGSGKANNQRGFGSLADLAKRNQFFQSVANNAINAAVDAVTKTGAARVSDRAVVRALKDKYRGTNVHWLLDNATGDTIFAVNRAA